MSNKSDKLANDLAKLVDKPNKGVKDSRNVLAKLYRQLMWDREITPLELERIINEYEERAKKNTKDSPMELSRKRSARIRAVAQDRITWSVFRRGLELLGVQRYTLVLAIESKDGRIKKSGSSSTQLYDLFEKIRDDWGIHDPVMKRKLREWWKRDDQKEIIARNNGRKPAGNLKRGLVSENITWTFFMKGLKVLGFKSASFQLNVQWISGELSSHETHEELDNETNE